MTATAYLDATRSVDERVADLLSRMSWTEKVRQLCALYWGRNPRDPATDLTEQAMRPQLVGGIGQICQLGKRRTRGETARLANRTQRLLREQTRLGIPALIHEETLHGMIAEGVTALAEPLHLAATWDPDLIERSFAVVAAEMRGAGVHLGLSPVLDLARDPRWGRMGETFGEDPCLVARMGVAAVRGLQGKPCDAVPADRIVATGKHFVGYGQGEGGHNVGPCAANWHEVVNAHLEPWRAAIREARLRSVMPSYAAVEGEPCHGSRRILTEVLRENLGFVGIVVSDYGGVAELDDLHHVADGPQAAARLAITAGMDCELPDGECYGLALAGLAEQDRAVADAVDRSVARVLRCKFLLGLFENPFVDESIALSIPEQADAVAGAGAAAGMILLKNDEQVLPLDRTTLRNVVVVGPHADENILGPYFGIPRATDTYLDALRRLLEPDVTVHFEPGCRITGPAIETSSPMNQRDPGKDHSRSRLSTAEDDALSIERAVKAVRDADCCILMLGDDFATTRESFRGNPQGDRADLGLLGGQRALYRALRATGVKMVVVLLRMGCIADAELFETAGTILDGGCGGQGGPAALASVLVGDAEPGGRLPFTVPRSAGHLPVFVGAPPAARRGYGFCADPIAFPFGHGLSYTQWALRDVTLDRDTLACGADATVRCRIRNTGRRAGSEVIQVYHRDQVAGRTRPARELVAFAKVSLEPACERVVTIPVDARWLGWYTAAGRWIQEPGSHTLWVATGSDPRGGVELTVTVDAGEASTARGQSRANPPS